MAQGRPRRSRVPARRLDRRRVQRRRGRRGRRRRPALFRQVQRVLKPNGAVRVLARAPDGRSASAPPARCEHVLLRAGPDRRRSATASTVQRLHPRHRRGVHRARARRLPRRHRRSSPGPHDGAAAEPGQVAEAPSHDRRGAPAKRAPLTLAASSARRRARCRCSRAPTRRGARRPRPRSIGPSSRRTSSRKSSASPTTRPGFTPRYVHHLTAVERRPDRVELLLLAQLGDPRLELVHPPLRARAPGSGCAWCSRTAGGG